ncbi:FAD-dependent oxidoreductase [Paenibacillus sp. HWE-109]|uniref:FAD-dependent oxidoreductase n=1 Tax=Paenibacillus sp. HWE-109 TaxID=1306526 RepID=UPI001EDDAA28|nr:FAD-dependent oxidoreductase [Paenibacillus sp. HWE-109]UKS28577.1 FAD-dependent oxidoreductase [Paenibacillus sp. HWE-109]
MKRLVRVVFVLIFVCLSFLPACESQTVPISKEKNTSSQTHVVVIGSEIEGMYLARAAVDEGLSVVVLDPREKPGGQLIQGQMQFLDEPVDDHNNSLLQGSVKTLFIRYKKGEIRKANEFEQYYNSLIKGIPIESGVTIIRVDKDAGHETATQTIKSLTYRSADGSEKTISANYWVENTDFAALTRDLGLERLPGIETVFGGSKDYMAASIMMKFRNVDWKKFQTGINDLSRKEVEDRYGSTTTVTDKFTWGFGKVGGEFAPSSKEAFLRGLNAINQRDGEVLINALLLFNVDPSNKESIQSAINLGKSETVRILPHLRQQLPGWEKAEINDYPDYLYIRDYNRYQTEYVLQASDLMSGRMFWDNVSIGGYPIDLQGTATHTWGQHSGDPDKYGMPLRSFIPKGYANVILAGKNVGASAVAYGSARIQANTALAAEVIGLILGKLKGEPGLTKLTEQEMNDIHTYLKDKYRIALSGTDAKNKIENLSGDQIKQLDIGKLTLP